MRFGKVTQMAEPPLGRLFPAGGPADPDMMIGRATDVGDLVSMLRLGAHCLIAGDRRIGKTTVCRSACTTLQRDHGFRVISVEVPERSSSVDLCQLVLSRCLSVGAGTGRKLWGAAKPLVEKALADRGIPLDLSTLGPDPVPATRRRILELPLLIARDEGRVVVFFDELQRVADYDDSDELLRDLTDLYAGQDRAMVLVDGSHQRTLDGLLGTTDGVGKLVTRRDLAPTIPRSQWRTGLAERFAQAEHPIAPDALEHLLDFGAEKPYPTMTAARGAAFTAHALAGETDMFCVNDGIESAKRQLSDDGL
jgi:hypothetical protein